MYTFSYDNCDINVVEPSVKMTVRSEPDVDQLLEFFQRFLVASGHIFDEDERLEVVKKEKNPSFSFKTYSDLDNTVFVGSGVAGGWGDDHITFAAGPVPMPAPGGKDIISFG